MIDLKRAYEAFGDMLAEVGEPEAAYCITMDVWNHRSGAPSVAFTLSAQTKTLGHPMAYQVPSLEVGLDQLRHVLLAERGRRGSSITGPEDLREVVLPEAGE